MEGELRARQLHLHTLTSASLESRALVAMTESPPDEVIHTHPLLPLAVLGFFFP